MTRRSPVLQICSLLFFLYACGTGDHEAAHQFGISTVDGVQIAANIGKPKYEADLFSYELIVELLEDEREESFLPNPGGFHMDERGWFYVPEYSDNRIAVFDSTGRYSHAFGREGSGPGEFRSNFSIVDLSGGIVTISAPTQSRITRFTTRGDLIDVTTYVRPSVFLNLVYPVRGDQFLALGTEQSSSPQLIRMRPIALLHDAAGDTIASVTGPWFDFGFYDSTDNVTYPVLFQPVSVFAFQRDYGFLVTTGESSSLSILDLNGKEIRQIDLGMERMPTTAQDRTRLREYYDAEIAVEGIPERMREYLATQRDRGRLAEYRTFWRTAQIDDGGFIWLEVPEHPLDAKSADNHSLWLIVSPEGEYLGYSRFPSRSGRVMRGHVLTLYPDMEAGAMRLQVYRIRPAVEGLRYPQ